MLPSFFVKEAKEKLKKQLLNVTINKKGVCYTMLMSEITTFEINKIFDNRIRKEEYLEKLFSILNIQSSLPRTIVGLNNCIMKTWNYDISKNIIREIFFESNKYLNGIACKDEINYLIQDWHR